MRAAAGALCALAIAAACLPSAAHEHATGVVKATALETESRKLMNASPNDLDRLGAQIRAVSQACGACHEQYRNKRQKGDM
jgi:hypothetical protein